jgi:predicted heme/steroid binding protein
MKKLISLFFLPLLCAGAQSPGRESISAFGFQWTVQSAADWSIESGVFRLLRPGVPPEVYPRRPTRFALLESKPYRNVTVEAEVKRNGRSVILVYAWQDDTHYNYAHISSDIASKTNVHNGIFHVFGGERVRISPLDGPASLPDQEWTPVRLAYNGDSGRCYVEVRGKRNPSLEAVDLSLRWGRIGLGSFDETGDFRNVRVTGQTRDAGATGTM